MSRIAIPATVSDAPPAARPLLQAVNAQLGSVPNLFRLISVAPAALEGFLGLSGALGKGVLPLATRHRIALAVAQINGCDYCLSAHTYLAKALARLDDGEITANRHGASNDPHAAAAVRFAVQVAQTKGRVSDADMAAVRAAGHGDDAIVEIIQHVALNVFTNYLNTVAQTEVDFPVVHAEAA